MTDEIFGLQFYQFKLMNNGITSGLLRVYFKQFEIQTRESIF